MHGLRRRIYQKSLCASCVTYTKKCLSSSTLKAVIINSGNANACTGGIGSSNTQKIASEAAQLLNLNSSEIGVASTGLIGAQLPMDKITSGLHKLLASPNKHEGNLTAEAILTTDTCQKQSYREQKIDKQTAIVSGITKGSGMIAPNMATTLSFVVTNVALSTKNLSKITSEAVDRSFNMTSVDTDTSTNDMLLVFSTGEVKIDLNDSETLLAYKNLFESCCSDLSKALAVDGEGASKLIEVVVEGSSSKSEAKAIAKSIVNSPLVKTAICGEDPNWGRVLAAAGKVEGASFDPNAVDLLLGREEIVKNGEPLGRPRADFKASLQSKEVKITIKLNSGNETATAWGCDLTHGYIDINTCYS